MEKGRRVRCLYCDSFDVYKRGSRNGVRRYQCKSCERYFTGRRKDISIQNRFIWFRQWVEYSHTIKYISKRSGYTEIN